MRYVHFIGDLLHGDLGTSALTRAPVVDQVTTALPLTLQLTFLGLAIAVVLALLGGVTAAIHRDRLPDQVIRVVSLTGVAAPGFWLALLMIQYLAVDRGWFPTGGYINPGDSLSGWLKTMTLPAFALSSRSPPSSPGSCARPWSRNWTRTTSARRSAADCRRWSWSAAMCSATR